jgi:hypothetical protein
MNNHQIRDKALDSQQRCYNQYQTLPTTNIYVFVCERERFLKMCEKYKKKSLESIVLFRKQIEILEYKRKQMLFALHLEKCRQSRITQRLRNENQSCKQLKMNRLLVEL